MSIENPRGLRNRGSQFSRSLTWRPPSRDGRRRLCTNQIVRGGGPAAGTRWHGACERPVPRWVMRRGRGAADAATAAEGPGGGGDGWLCVFFVEACCSDRSCPLPARGVRCAAGRAGTAQRGAGERSDVPRGHRVPAGPPRRSDPSVAASVGRLSRGRRREAPGLRAGESRHRVAAHERPRTRTRLFRGKPDPGAAGRRNAHRDQRAGQAWPGCPRGRRQCTCRRRIWRHAGARRGGRRSRQPGVRRRQSRPFAARRRTADTGGAAVASRRQPVPSGRQARRRGCGLVLPGQDTGTSGRLPGRHRCFPAGRGRGTRGEQSGRRSRCTLRARCEPLSSRRLRRCHPHPERVARTLRSSRATGKPRVQPC